MKFFKKLFLFIVLIFVLMVVYRGTLFRNFVKYYEIGERKIYKSEKLNYHLESKNIDELVDFSLNKTSENLNFSFEKCESNPNKLIVTKEANCIGYSGFFALLMKNLLEENDLQNVWKVSHKIGKIEIFGIDIHQYFSSPFFKDHDFVLLENVKTGKKIAVDPSEFDYFTIDRISLKN